MNTAIITKKKQAVCGIITEMNQVIPSSNFEPFKYKTNITGNTYNLGVGDAGYDATKVGNIEPEVVIPLKH